MKAIALLSLTLALHAQQAHAAWAAVAFNRQTHESQLWSNARSEDEAKRGALQACGAGCEVVGTSDYAFVAFANSNEKGFAWAEADEPEKAVAASIQTCNEYSDGVPCHWSKWARNNGDFAHPMGNVFNSGPAKPTLASVGGAWSHQIANFQGFTSKNTELCWAAITKTIYFAAVGFELSQYRLAEFSMLTGSGINSPADLAGFTPTKRGIQCTVDNTNDPQCNQPGSPQAALIYVGKGLSYTDYPNPTDSVGIYRAIRESLSKELPVGMTFKLFNGAGHLLVVYGADFHASAKNPSLLQPDLYVFDPANGKKMILQSNTYYPEYKMAPEQFNGWLALGNYKSPMLNKGINPRACPLFNSTSVPDVCPK